MFERVFGTASGDLGFPDFAFVLRDIGSVLDVLVLLERKDASLPVGIRVEFWRFTSLHATELDQVANNFLDNLVALRSDKLGDQSCNTRSRLVLQVRVLFLLDAIHDALDSHLRLLGHLAECHQRVCSRRTNAQIGNSLCLLRDGDSGLGIKSSGIESICGRHSLHR